MFQDTTLLKRPEELQRAKTKLIVSRVVVPGLAEGTKRKIPFGRALSAKLRVT